MAVDPATAELAGQLVGLGLEIYRGRKLGQAERDALVDAVRKAENERTFTPTDSILGEGVETAEKNPEAAGTPDAHA